MISSRESLPRRRVQTSCDRCREGKRRCDRSHPCARCRRDQAHCTYDGAQASRVQRRRTSGLETFSGSSANAVVGSSSIVWSNVLQQDDATARMKKLLDMDHFLHRIFATYMRELDWIVDLLADTRLDDIVRLYPRDCHHHLDAATWSVLQPLAFAVVAVTAQMCSTEVDAILMSLFRTQNDVVFLRSSELATLAYSATKQIIEHAQASLAMRQWPVEYFAASMYLRLFEKNTGDAYPVHESVLLDARRLQLAGFQHDRQSGEAQQDNLLAYRVFWSYFDKDRVASWFSRAGYTFHSRHCHICLRDEAQTHISMDELCEKSASSACQCQGSDQPRLSLFAAVQARTGALLGRFFDRTADIRLSTFRWPQDAEQVAKELDDDVASLHAYMTQHQRQNPHLFRNSQVAYLRLTLAYVRTDIAKYMCDVYAETLQGKEDNSKILWMLQRRRSEANVAMILEAAEATAELSRYTVSWVHFPHFIARRTLDLVDFLSPWLSRSATQPMLPIGQARQSLQEYLWSCVDAVLVGRNIIVLLTRRNELAEAKRTATRTCTAVARLLLQDDLCDIAQVFDERDCVGRVKAASSPTAQAVSAFSTSASSESVPTPANEPDENQALLHALFDVNFDLDTDNLFADLPSLENMFKFPVAGA